MAIKIKKSIYMAIKNMLYDNTNFMAMRHVQLVG